MYKEEKISNKKIILLLAFLFFLIVIAIFFYVFFDKNYENAKVDPNKNYVYRKSSEYSDRYKSIPYINVEGDYAKKINTEIEMLEENYASLPDNKIGFVFNKSGPILSICIKIVDCYTNSNHSSTFFKTYILNLETKNEYTKEEIYRDYEVDNDFIANSLDKQFQKMYQEVVEEGYLDSDYCDYTCFLQWRGVDHYLDGAQLYIENRTLTVFRGFLTESIFGEEEYFEDRHFKFVVSK